MSAEILRRAAALMRERAEAARAGKWKVRPSSLTPDAVLVTAEWANDSRRVATCAGSLPEGNALNAEHIASWHPAVALAVADWLDQTAAAFDEIPLAGPEHEAAFPAFAVARLYLREAADDRAA